MMTVPLVRGRFCELLAPLAGLANHANDLFLMGLLSVMDAILDQPLETILAELPVRREIKDALLAGNGAYCKLLEVAVAQERAEWDRVSTLSRELRMNEERISEMYVEAVDWSTALGRSVQSPVTK